MTTGYPQKYMMSRQGGVTGDDQRFAWPAADEYGDCVVSRFDHPVKGTWLRIERADPVIRISPELLSGIPEPSADWPVSFDGKILRIQAVNQTVVYRIRDVLEPRPGRFGCWDYIGEWPD